MDPISNHAFPPKPSQRLAKESDFVTASSVVSELTSLSGSREPTDGSSATDPPSKERPRTEPASSRESNKSDDNASVQTREDAKDDLTLRPETQHQRDLAVHAWHHIQEIFSNSPLRPYATIGLVDRNRLQLYHANRSVILVSSAIDFSEGDGLDKFIATVIACNCLWFKRHGRPSVNIKTPFFCPSLHLFTRESG